MSSVLTNFWKVIKCICSEITPPNFGVFDFDLKILTVRNAASFYPLKRFWCFQEMEKGSIGNKSVKIENKVE